MILDYAKGLRNQSGGGKTPVTAGITKTVGTGGDYADLQTALEDLGSTYTHAVNGTELIELSILTEYVISTQVTFFGVDLSFIKITSVDASVSIDFTGITTCPYPGAYQPSTAIFNFFDGAKSPKFAFAMTLTNVVDQNSLVYARGEDTIVTFGDSQDATRIIQGDGLLTTSYGAHIIYHATLVFESSFDFHDIKYVLMPQNEGKIIHEWQNIKIRFYDCGYCIYGLYNAKVLMPKPEMYNCEVGLYACDGSDFYCYQVKVDRSSGYPIHATNNARIQAGSCDLDNTAKGILSDNGSHVDVSGGWWLVQAGFEGLGGSEVIWANDNSTIIAEQFRIIHQTTSTNYRGVKAERGSFINCAQMDVTMTHGWSSGTTFTVESGSIMTISATDGIDQRTLNTTEHAWTTRYGIITAE